MGKENEVIKTESMHQNLLDKSNHHQCIVDSYESSMIQIQEELTQTKAKLVALEKEREQSSGLSQLTNSSETRDEKWKTLNEQLKNEIQNALQQKQFYMNSLAETNRMLAEIQSKFDTSHTDNQSMSSLLFNLKKEQKETFEKLKVLEEEKEILVEKIAVSETDAQKKILALEIVKTENLILTEKVTTLAESNENSNKKIESLEKRIEDEGSSEKESVDFESQFPIETISSISDDTVDLKESKQPDAIVTDEKPPVNNIMEIHKQRWASSSNTGHGTMEMEQTLMESVEDVKEEPDQETIEIKDGSSPDIIEIKENRKRHIKEMQEHSNNGDFTMETLEE